MGANLSNALFVTAIGMGLVFVMILLLWGLMALMVRLLPDHEEAEESAAVETVSEEVEAVTAPDAGLKRKAAAAAVAVALAGQARRVGVLTTPAGSSLTAWQTVMRANQIKSKQQRGPVR